MKPNVEEIKKSLI